MRIGQIGRASGVVVVALLTGLACGESKGPGGTATPVGQVTGEPSATGAPTTGTPTSTPTAGVSNTNTPVNTGPVQPTASTVGTGVMPNIPMDCSSVAACGGDVAGTWNVTSSCLELSGDMDIFITALACATVPVTGYLQTSGTFTANTDGTYVDDTVTTGSVSFPLDSSCLAISGVPVECNRAGNIFGAMGWKTSACALANGQCECSLSTQQEGGLGAILSYTEPMGRYSTAGSVLTARNVTYDYCAADNTLTLTPKVSALTGTVVLQREGTAPVNSGVGGMAGQGGMSGGEGGMSGGEGGMSGGEGGTSGGEGGAAGTLGEGGMSSEGGGAGMQGEGGAGGNGGTVVGREGPCDIYAAAGQSCVAAHSTVRALFASYDGNLYQVTRESDGTTFDVPVLGPGGFADSAQQDTFCAGTGCTITRVYDQSGNGNFIEAQTPDSSVGGFQGQTAANADAEQLTVGGNDVYSLFTRPSQAYWRDGSESGMPLGAEPQGVYMVTSGTHYNGGCCYNYGNSQTSRTYEGGPTMDSVYFGACTIWGSGAGEGPWVMADMEDGIVSGNNTQQNPELESLPFPYVTAMEKNNGTTEFAIRGADATNPALNTYYKGALPAGKNPMRKEGAIVLGSGGDCCYSNNNASEGTFYEGAIVAGYPADATEEAVHQNIVETGYGQ